MIAGEADLFTVATNEGEAKPDGTGYVIRMEDADEMEEALRLKNSFPLSFILLNQMIRQ